MRIILLMCLFAAAAAGQMPKIEPGVSQELAKWRAVQYSNISYKLNLTLEKMSPVLKGSIEIHVTVGTRTPPSAMPAEAGRTAAIILDWRKLPGHEDGSTISNVSINGKTAERLSPQAAIADGGVRVPFEERDDHLIFRDGVKMGENVIKLDFTSPILTSGSAITRYIDKEDGSEYIYSLFVPSDASTAFPCFDQPDLKAKFQVRIGAPESWRVVSNTQGLHSIVDCIPARGHTECAVPWTFPETQPISTYVFAFAAGPFRQYVGVPGGVVNPADVHRSIFVRQSQVAKFQPHAAEVARLRDEGVKYLESYFDYKFPFPKLDLVLIPEFPFGGMEHAGAIFLRETSVIFPAEPTKGDYLTRANLIFHETAHQWFGDTVTMRWFDDLWLKEGFAEFMAYKTLEQIGRNASVNERAPLGLDGVNAWKVFYERNKQAAYATDSTRGTTPIYQKINNLSAAKSAYGNIVYRKAPSFLRQAEFYLGEDKFQTAVRAFLKKHEFGNATWEDLVKEFEKASGNELTEWATEWVKQRGAPVLRQQERPEGLILTQKDTLGTGAFWEEKFQVFAKYPDAKSQVFFQNIEVGDRYSKFLQKSTNAQPTLIFQNYQDFGYGIFLLDDKSRDYVLKHIGEEKDPFLRSMMWGSLWDSVREAELDPREYVELAIKQLGGADAQARTSVRAVREDSATESDETIVASVLGRVSTALNYYIPAPDTAATSVRASAKSDLRSRFEAVLLDRLQHAPTAGQRITFYRAYVANASTDKARAVLKEMLRQGGKPSGSEGAQPGIPSTLRTLPTGRVSASNAPPLRTKDRFDIVTRLIILGDPEAPKLLAGLEKTETSDDAKRYAYAAHAAFSTADNKQKFFNDFLTDKAISESWIESAIVPFNSILHAGLTQPYLERSLKELPNLKRTRKIFFINNWLAAFIGGQRDKQALEIVNKFLADNPQLDDDLRLKILENVDLIERAVKIRARFP